MYWFLLSSLLYADDCLFPMVIRKILPLDGETDVPINSQITISLVGTGNEDHMTFALREHNLNLDVPLIQESSCYIHESDAEFHCTIILTPLAPLHEYTLHTLTLTGTEIHQEESFYYSTEFMTGADTIDLSVHPPVLEILDYIPRPESALDSCDWPDTMKYDLHVDIPDRDTQRNIILQVYEIHPQECTSTLVHSLFPAPNMSFFAFRQVLPPEDHDEHCYLVIREDWAGNQSPPSQVRCWDIESESDYAYQGCKNSLDSISIDDIFAEEPYEESAPEPSQSPIVNEEEETSAGGCAGVPLLFVLFIPLFRLPTHES